MSLFRKPKRNVRQRQADSDEDLDPKSKFEDDPIDEIHSRIAKFKEKKADKKSTKKTSTDDNGKEKTAAPLLSFGEDLSTGDDGEIFRVKKSSQSRRLMKQKKRRNKYDDENEDNNGHNVDVDNNEDDHDVRTIDDSSDIKIKIKDNLPNRHQAKAKSWVLSGKEAEALHLEEEDEASEEEKEDPLQKLLKSGAIPDAIAIHAARKQRQAMRDGAGKTNYIPINNKKKASKNNTAENSADDDDSGSSGDEGRLNFAGIKSDKPDMLTGHFEVEDDEHGWEAQQIRKVMKNSGINPESANTASATVSPTDYHGYSNENSLFKGPEADNVPQFNTPISYNLEGIKGRLKLRLTSLDEVHRRHESDLDKIVDDLVAAQSEIDILESRIPKLTIRHRFYQDLRGYVTDLVECFNEKVLNIKYLEDKLTKMKSDMTKKMMERRREDVRDQMRELAPNQPSDVLEDPARQRRSAERDGRRRRRQQYRAASQKLLRVAHNDGMSSDDEMSSQDQANIGKIRSDVENQARFILSDVVEDFSTLEGVMARFEAWKSEDPDSYSDAYVSICLPKIFSPLVRLQLLFWNPLSDHSNIESMEWFTTLAGFSLTKGRKEDLETLRRDPDRNLLTLMVEKVVVVKITGLVQSTYDPLSTTQTLKLTGTVNNYFEHYPTLTGESKQVRDLLVAVKDRLKSSLDQDVYIPVGYQKQSLENVSGPHWKFLNRQFWSAFKLFKNIICWHGILADKVLIELAVSSLLNRYLVVGLTVNPDPIDALNKSRHIMSTLPSSWIKSGRYKTELQRFCQYLKNLKLTARQGPEYLKEVSQLISFLGD